MIRFPRPLPKVAGAAAALTVALVAIACRPQAPVVLELGRRVDVAQGALEGVVEDSVAVFRGIPFAEPPTGELRWRAPRPAAAWDGVRDASAFGPACPQPSRQLETSEDCLTLNVWAPARRTAPLPVMVWIHGGGFRAGAGSSPAYDGGNFAAADVVLVTMNYRLGALGFFAHDALQAAHPDEPRGPYGLMDMVLALEWVRDSVAAFGGDPQQVTIFGESAGGMAVQLLMATPSAGGLFHRAIAQSGYGTWPLPRLGVATRSQPRAEDIGAAIVARAGGAADATAEALRAMDAGALAAAVEGLHLPVVDGEFLPDEPGIQFVRGRQHDVPFVAGGNSYDGTVILGGGSFDGAAFLATFGDDEPAMRELYADDFAVSETLGASRLFGDNRYLIASRLVIASMAKVTSPGYLYYFSHVPPSRRDEWQGAPHASELGILFGNGRGGAGPEPDAASVELGEAMRRYWVAFARTGDPNVDGLPSWPVYDAQTDVWMEFGEAPMVRSGVIAAKLDALEARYRERVADAMAMGE